MDRIKILGLAYALWVLGMIPLSFVVAYMTGIIDLNNDIEGTVSVVSGLLVGALWATLGMYAYRKWW